MLDYLNPFSEKFILYGVLDFLKSILDYINPFSENFFGIKFIELLSDMFADLFIPGGDFLIDKINSIKSKFSFIEDIKSAINDITNVIYDENNSPSFSISIPSNIFGISELEVINLSWYIPYKEYGDTIICCFAYVFFVWRIFIKLPSIISGSSGSIDSSISYVVSDNKKGGK